jgi:hypothetical protein
MPVNLEEGGRNQTILVVDDHDSVNDLLESQMTRGPL